MHCTEAIASPALTIRDTVAQPIAVQLQVSSDLFMNARPELLSEVQLFLARYDQARANTIWKSHSEKFRAFWRERVMAGGSGTISDAECDQVISILDRNGKGNTKDSEAIARVMVPQGAWRRMFNELHLNKALGAAMDRALNEHDADAKASAIDEVYALNAEQKNYLTGRSGNAIGAMLAAFDPDRNLSMISLRDRQGLIQYLRLPLSFDWEGASAGTRMALSNGVIFEALQQIGLPACARTISVFLYEPAVRALWKDPHTVKLPDGDVNVSVPTIPEEEEEDKPDDVVREEVRESMQIQGLLAKIGAAMGCKIWLPRADRSRVLKAWTPEPGQLLESLPLAFDSTTIATIEQIDVLWLNGRSIVRAFEVEHTTSIYSGLLRMADLVALQPNLKVKLHIVASIERREKVLREMRRPVFSLLEGFRSLCTYISYDKVHEISELPHLEDLKDRVIGKYEEPAEGNEVAP